MKILKTMESIVNNQVEYYKSDFFDYDLVNISNVTQGSYIWIARKCGTNLIDTDGELSALDYYIKESGDGVKGFYKIDIAADTIEKIDPLTLPKIRDYKVVFKNYNNCYYKRSFCIKAFDLVIAHELAENLYNKIGIPDGFTHFEVIEE